MKKYSHLFNKRGGWNKRGASWCAKSCQITKLGGWDFLENIKAITLINVEWREEKSKNSINVEGGFLFCGGWNFSKSVSVDSTFIREMRVH